MGRSGKEQCALYKEVVSNELVTINKLTDRLSEIQKNIHILSIDTLEEEIQALVLAAEGIESIEEKRNGIYKEIRSLYGLNTDGDFLDLQTCTNKAVWEELDSLYRKLKISILQFRSQLNILILYLQECENLKKDLLDEFFPSNSDARYTKSGGKSDQLHAGLLCDWST